MKIESYMLQLEFTNRRSGANWGCVTVMGFYGFIWFDLCPSIVSHH